MILYKYCDERGIDLLRNTRLKVSNLSDINDPFEFLPQIEEGLDELTQMLDALYHYQRENYRILSLSKSECNIVMWGHYCNKHRGILFKIDTNQITDVKQGENTFVEVIYAENRPKIDLEALIKALRDKDRQPLEANLKLLTYTKFRDWRYEQEVRAIVQYDHEENYDYYNIPAGSIVEVVLGMIATWETQTLVKGLLQESRFHHVRLKKAETDKTKYSLVYKGIDIETHDR